MIALERYYPPDAIDILLAAKVNVNAVDASNRTALMYLVKGFGDAPLAEKLLTAGALVNMTDANGKSALDYAKGNAEMTAILKKGAVKK